MKLFHGFVCNNAALLIIKEKIIFFSIYSINRIHVNVLNNIAIIICLKQCYARFTLNAMQSKPFCIFCCAVYTSTHTKRSERNKAIILLRFPLSYVALGETIPNYSVVKLAVKTHRQIFLKTILWIFSAKTIAETINNNLMQIAQQHASEWPNCPLLFDWQNSK